jgi:electron transfer flavoprotein alpha subunit
MVLVFAEQQKGTFKKATFEALSYGSNVAQTLGSELTAVVLGECQDTSILAKYGADKILHNSNAALNNYSSRAYTNAMAQVAKDASVIIFSDNVSARGIAPRLSARLQAGLVSGAIALPDVSNGFKVKKNVFSGKAFAYVNVTSDKKIISLTPNAFGLIENPKAGTVESFEVALDDKDTAIQVLETSTVSGDTVPLPEAELVVSGGRGLKGPENWGMIEELAATIGATLACSRPVADSHWRPHHEHVGQTGGTIRPNLYIAIGISGAIQHLAGVNASKTIVVINKDPEAPFFKAADYGIVGDAFEVVPKLTEALKSFKAAQAN